MNLTILLAIFLFACCIAGFVTLFVMFFLIVFQNDTTDDIDIENEETEAEKEFDITYYNEEIFR